MHEYAFDLDKTSVPAGCVQFNIKNNGTVTHSFDLTGIKAGSFLAPGGTESWSVQLTAGNKPFQCDVPGHAGIGMTGTLTVN
jgi:uncharacterized cupredoxin-like copper-binding protein